MINLIRFKKENFNHEYGFSYLEEKDKKTLIYFIIGHKIVSGLFNSDEFEVIKHDDALKIVTEIGDPFSEVKPSQLWVDFTNQLTDTSTENYIETLWEFINMLADENCPIPLDQLEDDFDEFLDMYEDQSEVLLKMFYAIKMSLTVLKDMEKSEDELFNDFLLTQIKNNLRDNLRLLHENAKKYNDLFDGEYEELFDLKILED